MLRTVYGINFPAFILCLLLSIVSICLQWSWTSTARCTSWSNKEKRKEKDLNVQNERLLSIEGFLMSDDFSYCISYRICLVNFCASKNELPTSFPYHFVIPKPLWDLFCRTYCMETEQLIHFLKYVFFCVKDRFGMTRGQINDYHFYFNNCSSDVLGQSKHEIIY